MRINRIRRILFSLSPLFFFSLIGFITHFPLLRFGLTSDHLLAIYEWRSRFIVPNINSFKAFINPYGASAILDKAIDWIWGFNPLPYFLIALLTKIVASLTIYYLAKYLFKSKSVGIIVALFSLVCFAGIQAVVPGATVYISFALMNIGFLKLLKIYDGAIKGTVKESTSAVILLIFSFAITPARMYPILPLLLIAEFTSMIRSKSITITAVYRVILFIVFFLILKKIGLVDSYGTASGVASNLTSSSFYQRVPNLPGLLLYTLGSYTQVLIPDRAIEIVLGIGLTFQFKTPLSYLLGLIPYCVIFYVLMRNRLVNQYWALCTIFTNSLVLLGITSYLSHLPYVDQLNVYFGGIIVTILGILFLLSWRGSTTIAIGAAVFFCTPVIFMMAAYFVYPLQSQETLSRYFAGSSFYGAMIIGYALYFLKNNNIKHYLSAVLISFVLITVNYFSIHSYFVNAGEDGTYNFYLIDIFNTLKSEIGNRARKSRALVYVQGDSPNFLSTTITNQGDIRFPLYYNDLAERQRPIFITDKTKLKKIFRNEAVEPYQNITDINAVYGFDIRQKKAYSITQEIREFLLAEDR